MENNISLARIFWDLSLVICIKQVPVIKGYILCTHKSAGFAFIFLPFYISNYSLIYLLLCCWRAWSFESCLKYFWKIWCVSVINVLLLGIKPTLLCAFGAGLNKQHLVFARGSVFARLCQHGEQREAVGLEEEGGGLFLEWWFPQGGEWFGSWQALQVSLHRWVRSLYRSPDISFQVWVSASLPLCLSLFTFLQVLKEAAAPCSCCFCSLSVHPITC